MKAIVLAAGEGKRLRPLTHTRPKCMIHVAGKPILERVLGNLREAGIREATVVVGYMKERVMKHFGDGEKIGMKISYVEQRGEYGTGAAFLTARESVHETFFGIAGDVVTEASAIKKIMKAHGKNGCDITLGLRRVSHPQHYGNVKLAGGKVVGLVEKPAHVEGSALVNTSMYVMEPSIFEYIEKTKKSARGEREFTDAIKMLIERDEAGGVELIEYWLDIGMPWQLLDANAFVLERAKPRKGKIENSTIVGNVVMEKGAEIFESYIEGPVYVGKESVIGPHAYIRPFTSMGARCSISDSTTVKNSIIMDGVNAKHLTYIGDSVIGEGCNFGAGTQIANFRFDEGPIRSEVAGAVVDSGKRKLGAVIGDRTKTGVLSCIMPGKTIGEDCWIGAGVVVDQNIQPRTHVFVRQNLGMRKR
ncbi:MAG: bifunctional sugar-1-phosphate nucleotidylyltransferase/acetyltransferase [Candidatus Micrarchaeota archaeon]